MNTNPMNEKLIPAVQCRDLRKDFGEGATQVQVLRGVDFDAHQGQLTFLVGPSGCGKTTLISVIAGLLDSSGGQVELFDQNVGQLAANERILFPPKKPRVRFSAVQSVASADGGGKRRRAAARRGGVSPRSR